VSADGRYLSFDSQRIDLVPGDSNGMFAVYIEDRRTGVIRRVSVDRAGDQGNRDSYGGAMNADGTRVAFTSEAANLVPGDTNGHIDVFVWGCPHRG